MIVQNSAEATKSQRRIRRSTQTFPRFIVHWTLILLLLFALLPLGIRVVGGSSPACVNVTGADYVIDMSHWVIADYAMGDPGQVVASPDNTAQAIFITDYSHPAALVLKTNEGQRQLTDHVLAAVWSHTGNRLFYVYSNFDLTSSTLVVADQNGNRLLEQVLPTGMSGVGSLQISADDRLITAQTGKGILIYQSADFQLVDQLPPTRFATNFVWSPVGHNAFIAQDDHLQVWSAEAGNLLSLPGQPRVVRWSPDGQALALLTLANADQDDDSTPETFGVGVYSLDGTIVRHLFDSAGTRLASEYDQRPRVTWLDTHTLALWQPTPNGRYALAHYDVAADQYTTIIDHAIEPGLFLPDKQHILYRVADGDRVRLMLASFTDGHPVMLSDAFGKTNSFYELQWSPDSNSFILVLRNQSGEIESVLWSREDGTQYGSLASVTYGWLGDSTLAYRGEDAKGAYAGLVNIAEGTTTRVLDGMDQISFIPVEQARRYGSYTAFYWQKAGGGSALDLYNPAGERLYRLPSDLNMDYIMGPYLNPVLFLSPDGKGVIVRSQERRWQLFNEGKLVLQPSSGNPEDVLWFPDSSAALVMSYDMSSGSLISQISREGTLERTLTPPYLSHGSHMSYRLNWCALDTP